MTLTQKNALEIIKEKANELLDFYWEIEEFKNQTTLINLREEGWSFEFNNRKTSLGLCNYKKKKIYVSKYLLIHNTEMMNKWEDTIRHEIAHAIAHLVHKERGHGYFWKKVAIEVGANPERTYKGNLKHGLSKYTLTCPNCGKKQSAHRKLKRKTACGSCCKEHNFGRYKEDFEYIITKNY